MIIFFIYIYSKNSQINVNIFLNVIYSCDANLNFQHHYSSLQSHDLQKSDSYF